MPTPEFVSRETWIAEARAASVRAVNADALARFGLEPAEVELILAAEAAGADEHGHSSWSADDVARAAGVDARRVRLLRAGLANSGLLAFYSLAGESIRLQTLRTSAPGKPAALSDG